MQSAGKCSGNSGEILTRGLIANTLDGQLFAASQPGAGAEIYLAGSGAPDGAGVRPAASGCAAGGPSGASAFDQCAGRVRRGGSCVERAHRRSARLFL